MRAWLRAKGVGVVKPILLPLAAACATALMTAACGSISGSSNASPASSVATPTASAAPGAPNPNDTIQSPKPTMPGAREACDLVTGLSAQLEAAVAHTPQPLRFVGAGEPVGGLFSCQYSYGSTPQMKLEHVIVAGISCDPVVYKEYTVEQPESTRETKTIYHLAPGIWEAAVGGHLIVQLTATPPVPFSTVTATLQQMARTALSVGCPS